ncbi:MAG: biotin/lipoyl-binding protein [Bryobacterales bacterium]|jgi:biotin carboxyl carrier protein|nr:biotin/lipoyl-binding protein [Bryobacterales bacterium]
MKMKRVVNGCAMDVEWREDSGSQQFVVQREGASAAPPLQSADVQEVEPGIYSVLVEGRSYDVRVEHAHYGDFVQVGPWRVRLEAPVRRGGSAAAAATGPAKVLSKMPGRVVKMLVSEGDAVTEGQGLLVLEAMKMQNELTAPRAGTVRGLAVQEGDVVAAGAMLCRVE